MTNPERALRAACSLAFAAALGLALTAPAPATAQAQDQDQTQDQTSEQGCQPSAWGAEDQIGSANLVSPDRVKTASQLIKQGKTQPLGIVISPDTPAYPPRGVSLQVVQPNHTGGKPIDLGYEAVANDDLAQLWFGVGSQLDGLGHFGVAGKFYNCNDWADFAPITGLTKLGTHNVPPLVGRAVILDMAAHAGVEHLEGGHAITLEAVEEAMAQQNVEIGEGDIVLFHTGWTEAKLESAPTEWGSVEPGILPEVAQMLADRNVMAVGADTWGLDVVPAPEGGKLFYSHVVLLMQHGIYILETMNTGPVLADGVNEFMFVLGQARVQGAVQMIINPVALY